MTTIIVMMAPKESEVHTKKYTRPLSTIQFNILPIDNILLSMLLGKGRVIAYSSHEIFQPSQILRDGLEKTQVKKPILLDSTPTACEKSS